MQEYRVQIGGDNQRYIDKHPELVSLLTELNIEILEKKPNDILKYLKEEFFAEKNHSNLYKKHNISIKVDNKK